MTHRYYDLYLDKFMYTVCQQTNHLEPKHLEPKYLEPNIYKLMYHK